MNINCHICSGAIEPGRIEIGLTVCLGCAKRGLGQPTMRKGVMLWGHKTAPELQVVSPENFSEHRRLNPYGRLTGRGSGVHVVSRKLI